MSRNAQHYFGANNTRASVTQNPAAYAHDNSSGLFGVKEFRKFGYAPDHVRDAAADREITKGYSKKKNPVCTSCWVQKSLKGQCNCS